MADLAAAGANLAETTRSLALTGNPGNNTLGGSASIEADSARESGATSASSGADSASTEGLQAQL